MGKVELLLRLKGDFANAKFQSDFYRRIRKKLKYLFKIFYTIYFILIFLSALIITWPFSWIVPRSIFAYICRTFVKLISYITFCPIIIENKNNLTVKPVIYTSNHCSYVDALVLLAALPIGTYIAVKKEAFKIPVIKTFLQKLNCIPIDRKNIANSFRDMETIKNIVTKNKSVMIFPEGTFEHEIGIRKFKSGAFKISCETNIPIVPMGLSGTRHILRANEALMMPGVVRLKISAPVLPNGNNREAINNLKDKVREIISMESGEPKLDFSF